MGGIVAVLHKKGEDVTQVALAMLKTLKAKNAQTYGIASPSKARIGTSLSQLQNQRMCSPILLGYAFSKIMKYDKPQPLALPDATLVFDGRTFPANEQFGDTEAFGSGLTRNREQSVKKFIQKTDGDFAFTIAEPQRLIAGRDALGVRPLYYGQNKIYAALASERKTLWKIGISDTESFPPGCVAIVSIDGFKFTPARGLTYSRPKQVSMKTASRRLRNLIEQAVGKRCAGLREVAVAFSGGLDSSIIAFLAKASGVNVELVHVSLKDQVETEYAKKMADELKLSFHSYTYTDDQVLETLPAVLYLIEESDPVKAAIGIPFYWAAENAAKMDIRVMLAGQGSDELFAGYRRYVDYYLQAGSEKAQETLFEDIVGMYESNFERDCKICNFHGVELRLPFAAYEIAKFAVDLPIELKIQPSPSTLRKLVLRHAAHELGLPNAIVDRPKKAIQYATGVSKVLDKIARQEHVPLKEHLHRTFQTISAKMMLSE